MKPNTEFNDRLGCPLVLDEFYVDPVCIGLRGGRFRT